MILPKQQLLELLIRFDPLLIDSDVVYESATAHFSKKEISNESSFNEEFKVALDDFFGKVWRTHINEGFEQKVSLIYSRLVHTDKELRRVGDTAWFDGTKVFKVASWPSQEIIHGKNVYVNEPDEQTIFLETNETTLDDMVHVSDDLALYFDPNGRVLAPGHGLDNLYLDQLADTPTALPSFIQGQVYIKTPSPELLAELRYVSIGSLGDIQYDKNSKIIYFGDKIGDTNIEVSSGFILSLLNGRIVNAWIKISE